MHNLPKNCNAFKLPIHDPVRHPLYHRYQIESIIIRIINDKKNNKTKYDGERPPKHCFL